MESQYKFMVKHVQLWKVAFHSTSPRWIHCAYLAALAAFYANSTSESELKCSVKLSRNGSGGGLAEFAVAQGSLAVKRPPEVSAAEGAGLPVAGLTALQALTKSAGIKLDGSGKTANILITAASGGVGHYAVQLAKLGNTHVTATCGARNIDLVKSLGADEILDYKTPDGVALKSPSGRKYDAVIHCATGIPWSTFEPNLSERGKGENLEYLVGYQFTQPSELELEAGLMEYKPDIIISVHPLMQHIPLWVLKWQGLQKKPVFVTVITDLNTCHRTWFNTGVMRCYCPSEEVAKRALLDGLESSQIRVFGLPIRPSFCCAIISKVGFDSNVLVYNLFLITNNNNVLQPNFIETRIG
ncbi:hypothetical protein IFM89_031930 [Coptis chinensis]|uniref:Uncharacterized protein n=1 Tax=Coptis chinensis TaxID=261450 RepID=A0A835MG51_9MAGN|nr:hypothetical protein IFM89_031930 [Coptis chinensis]